MQKKNKPIEIIKGNLFYIQEDYTGYLKLNPLKIS